ncbi:MAG TPA: DegQ family serine endoprotease [Candidatus Acidoferrales bacterium]|nr:DegQ family serine endoprotease [Candidatus Acidoferrales bacterium]
MYKRDFWRRPKAIVAAAALVVGLGGVGLAAAEHLASQHPALALNVASQDEAPSRTGFAPVVKKALPSVVSISSSKVTKMPTGFQQMPDDPFFRQFFGRDFNRQFREAPEQREHALGSGVIMTSDGYIVTNNHVVDGATDVSVTLGDKREYKAKVVGTDPKSDIAVLKIDAAGLPAITIADSSKVQVGDYALAIGNPFGVGQTVTMGIVSATGRSHLGIEEYEDFIQTDAPINPGNSGGALVNDRGHLIGINTAIIAHGSEGNQGIGFAVPANMARNVMEQIVKNGKVTRAYLGIIPQDLTPAIARAFGDKEMRGALVGDVSADSPAQKAGLQKGDIILSVNGKPVADSNDLRMTISMMAPDSNVNLKVFRNGGEREMAVKLGELPTTQAAVERHNSDGSKSALSGVSVEDLDAQTARDLGIPANSPGVVVTNVSPASAAAEAGLRRGDVIQEVNRKPVKNTSDFERAMSASKEETLLLVNRKGSTLYLAV